MDSEMMLQTLNTLSSMYTYVIMKSDKCMQWCKRSNETICRGNMTYIYLNQSQPIQRSVFG